MMPISKKSEEFVRSEGYSEPDKLLAKSLERAGKAEWHALPPGPGVYVNWKGDHFHFENLTEFTGERATWFYLQAGPYLRVPDDAITDAVDRARPETEAAENELRQRIERAQIVLSGKAEA